MALSVRSTLSRILHFGFACAPRDDPEIFQGAYIYPPNIAVPQGPIALDEDRQRKLVEFTEEFLQSIGV
ncbi:hypothetical protein EV421DRAFT_1909484 [Armillaria borealis]|uniref:Uncharacterized protein n=1 Tax=Armillaria borealis TaxID=47425 RepID=A0AA39J2N9_9AGAR|nr:hypothetical protein EV421DRAFT_1909484 [Armillaria borealis]